MSFRDEHARGVANGGRPDDRLLPAGGNYRGLVEGLPLIVYIDGPEAGSPSLYVSPQTSCVLGYTPEDWASSPGFFLSILHPDDRERIVEQTAHMLETGRRSQVEYRVVRADGRVVWLRDEGVVVSQRRRRPALHAGLHARRHRAQALAVLAAAQAALLEFIATGAALPLVLDGIARFVEEHSDDDLLASILLLDRDGMHLRHGAAPSLPAFWREAVDGIAIGPKVGSCGTAAYRRERVSVADIATTRSGRTTASWPSRRCCAPAGRRRSSRPTASLLGTFALYYREPRESAQNDCDLVELATHLAGIAIERSRSGDAARESEDRYRDLFENANEPIGTVTMDDEITDVNRAFELVLGYDREELIGTNLAEYLTPGGLIEARNGDRAQALGRGRGHDVRAGVHREGRPPRGARGLEPVIMEDGRPMGVQGICRDITARKQADAELRRLSELNLHLSLHDGLTGLPNRASFREQVEREIDGRRSRRLRARGAADGPRSLQGDQRHARPPLRRPAAGRAGAAADLGHAQDRLGRTARRGRVRGAGRPTSPSRQRPRARDRADPRGARAAVPGQRPAAARRGEHRRRALSRARGRRRPAAAARRRRDVPRQGLRHAARRSTRPSSTTTTRPA